MNRRRVTLILPAAARDVFDFLDIIDPPYSIPAPGISGHGSAQLILILIFLFPAGVDKDVRRSGFDRSTRIQGGNGREDGPPGVDRSIDLDTADRRHSVCTTCA